MKRTPSTARTGPLHARLIGFLVVTLLVLGLGTAGIAWWQIGIPADELMNQLPIVAAVTAFGLLGVAIIVRQPANAMGWLFAAVGLVGALSGPELVVDRVLADSQGGAPSWAVLGAWYQEWFWIPLITLMLLFIPLLFPTGRLPSPRWRPLVWLAGFSVALATMPAMFQERLDGTGYDIANPIGVAGATAMTAALWRVAEIGLLVSALGVAAAVIVRFRRAEGTERQQLKAFTFVAATAAFLTVLEEGVPLEPPVPYLMEVLGALMIVAIPISAGLAVLRYRLYELDRLISRTVSYAVLTLMLVTVYALSVVALGGLVHGVGGGGGGDLVVAASTLLVAAVFGSGKRRIQSIVDRRFNRSRYDATQTVESFALRLRYEVDLELLRTGLLDVVGESVRPRGGALWTPPPREEGAR